MSVLNESKTLYKCGLPETTLNARNRSQLEHIFTGAICQYSIISHCFRQNVTIFNLSVTLPVFMFKYLLVTSFCKLDRTAFITLTFLTYFLPFRQVLSHSRYSFVITSTPFFF